MENPVKVGCLGTAMIASILVGILAWENGWFGPIWAFIAAPWLFLVWWGWRHRSATEDQT